MQIPEQYLDFKRQSTGIDYVDLVQVATLYCHKGTDHPLSRIDAFSVPAFKKLKIDPEDQAMCRDLEESRSMLY